MKPLAWFRMTLMLPAVAGAHLHDNGESNEGRAYVYHGPGSSTDCPHDKP